MWGSTVIATTTEIGVHRTVHGLPGALGRACGAYIQYLRCGHAPSSVIRRRAVVKLAELSHAQCGVGAARRK